MAAAAVTTTFTNYHQASLLPTHEQPTVQFSEVRKKPDQLNEDSLSQFLNSVQSLLLKYRMYSKSPDLQVTSGGLQQHIRKITDNQSDGFGLPQRFKVVYSNNEPVNVCIHCDDQEKDSSIIQWLPIDLKLHIFSYLDAKSLCAASCVNQEWSQLACDEILWQNLLEKDMLRWSQLSHLTNPNMYLEVSSEMSLKEIYLRCSPESSKHVHHLSTAFYQVSSLIKYFLPKKIPKVAMFGPGLEQSTSGIVRKILYEENSVFTPVAMFPGQFDGVGGGITLKLQTGHSLHLSVLYSASKQERENRGAQERLQENKLLQRQENEAGGDSQEPHYELKPQIKHLCHVLDGFIFVIDASDSKEDVSKCRGELMAMLRERRSASRVPVLVLSCVKQADSLRIPACDIVDILQLSSILQPWLVIDCVSETLNSVDTGVTWLVNQTQLK